MDVANMQSRVCAERNEERAERLRFRGLEVVLVCECGMAGTEVLCAPAVSELLHKACA